MSDELIARMKAAQEAEAHLRDMIASACYILLDYNAGTPIEATYYPANGGLVRTMRAGTHLQMRELVLADVGLTYTPPSEGLPQRHLLDDVEALLDLLSREFPVMAGHYPQFALVQRRVAAALAGVGER